MPSLLLTTKQSDYSAQRGVSLGAGITLAFRIGHLTAMFNCANHVAEILGDRDLQDLGDGVFESIPIYDIPLADAHKALAKLSAKMSVALVDFECGEVGRFVLVWKIPAHHEKVIDYVEEHYAPTHEPEPEEITLDNL